MIENTSCEVETDAEFTAIMEEIDSIDPGIPGQTVEEMLAWLDHTTPEEEAKTREQIAQSIATRREHDLCILRRKRDRQMERVQYAAADIGRLEGQLVIAREKHAEKVAIVNRTVGRIRKLTTRKQS